MRLRSGFSQVAPKREILDRQQHQPGKRQTEQQERGQTHGLEEKAGNRSSDHADARACRHIEWVVSAKVDAGERNRKRQRQLQRAKPALTGERDRRREGGRRVARGKRERVRIFREGNESSDARAGSWPSASPFQNLRHQRGDARRRGQQ